MTGRHFLSLLDLGRDELRAVLDQAEVLKAQRGRPEHPRPLAGQSVALVFEKASTRTRLSFEVGVHELGGQPLTILRRDSHLARGESLSDTARMLSRYVHAVVYRTHAHDRVEELAASATIPVINGLTARNHPCQLLADLLTVREAFGRIDGLTVAWIGDGNNMAHSWILAAAQVGLTLRVACPVGYAPDATIVAEARARGARIQLTDDPREAAAGAQVVTTDVWSSMGDEAEADQRKQAFRAYQVDGPLLGVAAADAIFLLCLPSHRGEEGTAEVTDGGASRGWDQAENRLHTQKALLVALMAPKAS
ncbi:MAG: ornithine carbamoyltransferase [Sandaracinaceae bacterium]